MARPTHLTDKQRTQALARHALLRPHLDDGVPLTAVARAGGVPQQILERWRRRYRLAIQLRLLTIEAAMNRRVNMAVWRLCGEVLSRMWAKSS